MHKFTVLFEATYISITVNFIIIVPVFCVQSIVGSGGGKKGTLKKKKGGSKPSKSQSAVYTGELSWDFFLSVMPLMHGACMPSSIEIQTCPGGWMLKGN